MIDDLRIALRRLSRQPTFAITMVLTLGLAIGLNATLFTLLDALIRPQLAMAAADRLYWAQLYGDRRYVVSNQERDSMVEAAIGKDALTRYDNGSAQGALVQRGPAFRSVQATRVAPNYFAVAGIRAVAGRTLSLEDSLPGVPRVVISERLAANLFPGESPVSATITVNGEAHKVVGVIAEKSDFPHQHTAVWRIGQVYDKTGYERLVRLREGESLAEFDRRLQPVTLKIADLAHEAPTQVAFRFHAAVDAQFHYQNFHIAIAAAVLAVLLVACFNLANIQLARAMSRRRELAVHVALGATRGLMIRHLLGEIVLLGVGGLVVGLALVESGARALSVAVPRSVGEFVVEPHLSWRVVIVATAAMVVGIVLVGVVPAITASAVDPAELLKARTGSGRTKASRHRYGMLVIFEIAFALSLISAAAVMVRSAVAFNAITPGYDPAPLVTGTIGFGADTGDVARSPIRNRLETMAARLRSLEDVEEAAAMFKQDTRGHAVTLGDSLGIREAPAPKTQYLVVTPSYLRTMGLHVGAGRDFSQTPVGEPEAIIDEATAKVLWGRGDPVGRRMKLGALSTDGRFARVVGVVGAEVGQAKQSAFGPPPPATILHGVFYLPAADETVQPGVATPWMSFVVRAPRNRELVATRIRRELIGVRNARGSDVTFLDEALGLPQARASRVFVASLFSFFAVVATLLVAFGVYGIVAYAVEERRREIGIRIALGASARSVLRTVLRESLPVMLGGIAVGLLFTKYSIGLLRSQALENDAYNAGLFALVGIATGLVVAGAAFIPGLRATQLDPADSLRGE